MNNVKGELETRRHGLDAEGDMDDKTRHLFENNFAALDGMQTYFQEYGNGKTTEFVVDSPESEKKMFEKLVTGMDALIEQMGVLRRSYAKHLGSKKFIGAQLSLSLLAFQAHRMDNMPKVQARAKVTRSVVW